MKHRELYLDEIKLNEQFSIQIDQNNDEQLLIFENHTVIDEFSLRKRIHTFFKILQELTEEDDYILLDQKTKLFGKEIHIKDHLYMKLTDKHICLTIEFYNKDNDDNKTLLYMTKLTYMTQKLFNRLLIPERLLNDETYQDKNALEFKDMLDILSYPDMIHV